jgi:hypothetical protein
MAINEKSNDYEERDLNEVFFSHGDTVYLDGNGVPFDDMNKPQPLPRQKAFMQKEKENQVSNLLDL